MRQLFPVLALLFAGTAFAQAPAAPAPAADPRLEGAPAGAITWPNPWATPRTLEYDTALVSTRTRGGQAQTSTIREITRIANDPAAAPGRGQVWTSRGQDIVFGAGFPPEQAAISEAMMKAMQGLPLRVALDADGSTSGLANLADLAPRMRASMTAGIVAVNDRTLAAIADPAQRAAAKTQLEAQRGAFLAQMGSDAALQTILLRTPVSYNFPGRGGMAPGEVLEFDAPTQSAIGGTPFPTRAKLQLAPTAAAGEVEFVYETKLDPRQSLPLLLQAVEKLVGQPLPEAVRARLPDEVHVATVTRWRIERATGIVRWMERVETRSILGAADRNVLTMTRR